MPIYKQDATFAFTDTNARIVTLYAAAAVTAGRTASIDTADTTNGAGYSVKISSADDDPACIGVFLDTSTAAGNVRVQVGGSSSTPTCVTGTTVAVSTAVGCGTTGGTGRVKQVGTCAATIQPFAVCVDAFTDGGTDGNILIIDKGFYKHG